MTRVKKQVTALKISEFLSKNQLVLVYHYNSETCGKWHTLINNISQQASVTSRFVSNNIVKKVFLRFGGAERSTSLQGTTNQYPLTLPAQAHTVLEKQHQVEPQQGANHTLFQGPNVFLGLNKMQDLEMVLKESKQIESSLKRDKDNNQAFFLMGGFYKNRILDFYNLERYSKLCANNHALSNLFFGLSSPSLAMLKCMQASKSLECLERSQYNLLSILYFRSKQLLLRSNQP